MRHINNVVAEAAQGHDYIALDVRRPQTRWRRPNSATVPSVDEFLWRERGQAIFRHVLPNIMAPMIITCTVTIGVHGRGFAELPRSGMSPAGVACSATTCRFMELAPWLAIWPGLSLTVVVYSLNMLGDALRDLLDPRLKGGVGRLGADNRAKSV